MKKIILYLVVILMGSQSAIAEEYWVNQYRAAPGKLPALLELFAGTNWQTLDHGKPILMRHSQGNQWDIMILSTPCVSSKCLRAMREFGLQVNALVDFEVAFMASSNTKWPTVAAKAKNAGLFHIEMFNAAAGKHEALMRQRQMENSYLAATGQKENVVFKVQFGSDTDVFTIGFHDSLASFAAQGPPSSEAAEKAAVTAGFKNRADISFLLRELIVAHYDTLAVPAK
jgi:hypothetical protein